MRREGHRYLREPELKEEGGTPAIVEAIRAGLVFQLKEAVTADVIMEREEYMVRSVLHGDLSVRCYSWTGLRFQLCTWLCYYIFSETHEYFPTHLTIFEANINSISKLYLLGAT